MAAEYKRQGGGYTTDKEHEPEAARHLDRWTQEDWQTADGSSRARDGDATHRYLPKEAWERLSPAEREEADRVKREADGQFVANPPAAAQASRAAREPLPAYDDLTVPEVVERLRRPRRGGPRAGARVRAGAQGAQGRAQPVDRPAGEQRPQRLHDRPVDVDPRHVVELAAPSASGARRGRAARARRRRAAGRRRPAARRCRPGRPPGRAARRPRRAPRAPPPARGRGPAGRDSPGSTLPPGNSHRPARRGGAVRRHDSTRGGSSRSRAAPDDLHQPPVAPRPSTRAD